MTIPNDPNSARVGARPSTAEDYWMITFFGLYLKNFFPNLKVGDPNKGLPFIYAPPSIRDHENNRGAFIAAVSCCLAAVVILTLLRIGVRLRVKGLQWGADDWVIIPAALAVVAHYICLILATLYGGVGNHFSSTTYSQYKNFTVINFCILVTGYPASGLIKISIVLFFRRLTGSDFNTWRWINRILLFCITSYTFAATMSFIFACGSPRVLTDPVGTAKAGRPIKCIQLDSFNKAMSAFHVMFDFILLMCALSLCWKLQMSRLKKLRICLLFSTALFSCLSAVMRNLPSSGKDITWNYSHTTKWSLMDTTSSVIVANLPVVYTLFKRQQKTKADDYSTGESSFTLGSYPHNTKSKRDTGDILQTEQGCDEEDSNSEH